MSYISAFEGAVACEARMRGVDGVVCGQIHRPEIREIGGMLYCNNGDLVESQSALAETYDGDPKIVTWHDIHELLTDISTPDEAQIALPLRA